MKDICNNNSNNNCIESKENVSINDNYDHINKIHLSSDDSPLEGQEFDVPLSFRILINSNDDNVKINKPNNNEIKRIGLDLRK
jgi:hypothetical protein